MFAIMSNVKIEELIDNIKSTVFNDEKICDKYILDDEKDIYEQ